MSLFDVYFYNYLKCVELRKQKLTYAKIVEYIFDTYKIKVGRTTINAALTGQTWKQNIKENIRSYEKRKYPKCKMATKTR